MKLLSFDPLRTLNLPGVTLVKPEHWFAAKSAVQQADWILFPEYWQVNALVYAWHKRIFPSINTFHLGHNKIEMTRAFQAICPQYIPQTLILPNTPAALEQILDEFSFPIIGKTVLSSMGLGVFFLENRKALLHYASTHDILYVQEYLPINKDLRIIVVGNHAVTGYWRVGKEGSHLNNIARGGTACFHAVPQEALQLVTSLAQALGINYAGFDIAVVDGQYQILEFNVRFGTQALRGAGITLDHLIHDYLINSTQPPLNPSRPWLPKVS